MTTTETQTSISRRAALTGIGAGGLGLALTSATRQASAQDATAEMANHPIVGTWFALVSPAPGVPAFASPSLYTADGYVVLGWPVSQAGEGGVTFHSGWVGSWEPTDANGIHFTAVQVLSDATGAYLGTLTVDGHPRVSVTVRASSTIRRKQITVRDPAGAVVTVIPGSGGVSGVRMGVGSDGFPAAPGTNATPAS